jgi:hypothetical protein
VIINPFKFFDWVGLNSSPATTVAPEWYSQSRITQYSPNGYPVEEQDTLGILSSARFGYNNTLPVLVAQNAPLNKVQFVDFEYGASSVPGINSAYAHSGRYSIKLSASSAALNYVFVSNYPIDNAKGTSVKLWLKSNLCPNIPSCNGQKNPNPQLKVQISNQTFDMKAIAQTGEWTLYSIDINNYNGLASGTYNIKLLYNLAAGEDVYVDDFRIQPVDASMNCSVYYPDNKLAAQFDDQHFGVFYEYNGKGQLVRKSIETERGKKTLQEQQYHTPLSIKN